MVVTAGDSYTADAGFADDAPDAMPGFSDDAMPMDGDIAALPDEAFEDGAATPETEPFSVESLALTPEQLAALEQHYSAQLTEQLQAQFTEKESLWEQQRQSLEAKVNAFDRDRQSAADLLQARQAVYAKFFEENGIDPRDLKALEYEVSQEAGRRRHFRQQQIAQSQQVQQQQTEAVAEFQTWQTNITSMMHEHAKSVGLDPTNKAINERFQEVLDAAQVWNETQSPAALKHYNLLKDRHKAWVTELGQSAQKRKAAKPSSEALNRQRARGPQNLSAGSGGGSAPLGPAAMIEVVRQEFAQKGQNPPYKDIHAIAMQRYYQQQQR